MLSLTKLVAGAPEEMGPTLSYCPFPPPSASDPIPTASTLRVDWSRIQVPRPCPSDTIPL